MPAVNPRISVTVTPSIDQLLQRIARITGGSKSSIIGELLETSVPLFEHMAVVLEAAVVAKDEMHQQVLINLVDAETQLGALLGSARQVFGDAVAPYSEEKAPATAAPPRARQVHAAVPQSPARPPLVTRGSGTPNSENSPMENMGSGDSLGAKEAKIAKKAQKRPAKALKSSGRG